MHRQCALVQLEQLPAIAASDRNLAGQRFVHQHAERIRIGARLDPRADTLLGGHVFRGTEV